MLHGYVGVLLEKNSEEIALFSPVTKLDPKKAWDRKVGVDCLCLSPEAFLREKP